MGHPAFHHKINYVEFTTTDIDRTKSFYATVFGWEFQDWGPDYVSFAAASGGIDGGFAKRAGEQAPAQAGPLVVIYSAGLKATEEAIQQAGGSIVVPIFSFPGGKRFHFSDGAGNTLAVWSETD